MPDWIKVPGAEVGFPELRFQFRYINDLTPIAREVALKPQSWYWSGSNHRPDAEIYFLFAHESEARAFASHKSVIRIGIAGALMTGSLGSRSGEA